VPIADITKSCQKQEEKKQPVEKVELTTLGGASRPDRCAAYETVVQFQVSSPLILSTLARPADFGAFSITPFSQQFFVSEKADACSVSWRWQNMSRRKIY
jgi:hypothetical protein